MSFQSEVQRDGGSRAQPGSRALGAVVLHSVGQEEHLPREGGEQPADAAQLPTQLQTHTLTPPLTQKLLGALWPSYLALTVSLKLSQLQGDLWILATYRNENEVSLAGVAHVG